MADPAYRTVAELLNEYRQRTPHKAALVDVERHLAIDFATLAKLVDALARQLLAHGATSGSRILLAGGDGLEKLLLWLAIWRIGAVVCPLDPAFVGAAATGRLLAMLAPALILAPRTGELAALAASTATLLRYGPLPGTSEHRDDATLRFAQDAADIDLTSLKPSASDDLAAMCCTSGTTGMPKVVVYDHACYWLNGLDSIDLLGFHAGDRMLEYRSFDWYSAQILSLMPFLQTGLSLHIAPRFSRRRFARWIEAHGISVCAGIPTVLNLLLEAPLDTDPGVFASLRVMSCSTSPLSPLQWRRFEQRYGIRVCNLYGSSEAGWMCGNRVRQRRVGTVGQPAAHARIDIVDADGASCPPGRLGQVMAQGAKLALGLLQVNGSIEPIRGKALPTRDIATCDADGYLTIAGRMDELIIRGGVKIPPQELEDVLLAHPQILDAAALGVPDPIYGQEPACFVVLRPGSALGTQEVLAHCRGQLPREKVPRYVRIMEALPRSARGKLLREALRREWWLAAHT